MVAYVRTQNVPTYSIFLKLPCSIKARLVIVTLSNNQSNAIIFAPGTCSFFSVTPSLWISTQSPRTQSTTIKTVLELKDIELFGLIL